MRSEGNVATGCGGPPVNGWVQMFERPPDENARQAD